MANSTLDRIRKRITLDSREGWIAGVCAGFARYLDTDPAFVRVAVIIQRPVHAEGNCRGLPDRLAGPG